MIIIVDRHPSHRSQKVKEWVANHPEGINLYYLPKCSPELNPTEYLNQDVKTNAAGKKRAHNVFELIKNIRRYLQNRQKRPKIVMNYFKVIYVNYALP